MPMQVIEEGRICSDCYYVLSGGEDQCGPECQHAEDLPIHTVPACTDHDECGSEFYKPFRPCPGCGTTDAGTWHRYAVLG